MDADVLYAPTLLDTLVSETDKSIVPYDTEFEPGEEPVKVCLRDGKAVDFGKIVAITDTVGEWVYPAFSGSCSICCKHLGSASNGRGDRHALRRLI